MFKNDTCSKGHTGELVKRKDNGAWRCRVCARDRHRDRRRRLQESGMTTDGRPRQALSTEDKFWSRVRKTEFCWIFEYLRPNVVVEEPKSRSSEYRVIWDSESRKDMLAHRYSYELHVGPIPDGDEWTIDHLCEIKTCVRPSHLELVTRSENSLRRDQRAKKVRHDILD